MGMVNTLKRLAISIFGIVLCAVPSFGAVRLYTQNTAPGSCNNGDLWVDTNAAAGERLHTCEAGTWVLHIGYGTSSNPSFNSVHASGGNLAAANKQVTKAWQTGLSYTADVTSVIHGGKHWIAKTTHTAGSTTEPGVGASYTDAWTEASGAGDNLGSATSSMVVALWASGSCSGYLKHDGTCSTPSVGTADSLTAQYIDWTASSGGASIANKPTLGTAAALNVGTGANNIPQLNSSGELPYTIPQLTSLQTASGLTSGDLHLGTFTGTTIADSSTMKTAFQALETAVEGKQASDADLTTWAGVTPGTGIAMALAVNVGSAGAPVLFNGAGGTPASLTLTNATLANSASLPGTCTIGQLYLDTDADTDGDLYICRATNTWKAVDDDGGAGGLATSDIDTSAKLRTIVTDESGTGALLFAGGDIGAATATTASNGDNDTSVATTAFVQTAKKSGVQPVCAVIPAAVAADDYPIFKAPAALTITGGSIHVYAIGGTNVVGGLDECTGTNGTCSSVIAVDSDITGTAGNDVADDGTLTNGGIASGNWIQWHTTSVSGTNTSLSVCFSYTLD